MTIPASAIATFLAYTLMAFLCIAWVWASFYWRVFRMWTLLALIGVCLTIYMVAHTDLVQAHMEEVGLLGLVVTAVIVLIFALVCAHVRARWMHRPLRQYYVEPQPAALMYVETEEPVGRARPRSQPRARGRKHYIPAPAEPEREARRSRPAPAPVPAPARPQQRRGGYVVNPPRPAIRAALKEGRRANVW